MKGLEGKKRGAGVKGRLLRAGAAVCAAVCWLGLMGAAEPDEDAVRALLQRGVRGDRLLSCAVEALKKLTSNVSYQSTMEMLFFDLVNRED